MNKEAEIKELNIKMALCKNCSLHKERLKICPGDGDLNADIMMIGEGPGRTEDKTGRVFSGAAGEYLDELLLGIGLRHEDVFLCNVIKCRAPDNRDPLLSEITKCNPFLNKQIEIINPKLIVTLGRFSSGKFFAQSEIKRLRGIPCWRNSRWIYPIYHPAAGLHNSELRPKIFEQFGKIPQILKATPDMFRVEIGTQGQFI